MRKTLLKRISLTYALSICIQPLLGIEKANPVPGFGSPQMHVQQQQPPFLGNAQHNTINRMNTAPQNQTISISSESEYVNTPNGLCVINQVIYQTISPVPQHLQYNLMQQNHLAHYLGNGGGQHTMHQQQTTLSQQIELLSQVLGGMKRAREEEIAQDTNWNNENQENPFNGYFPFELKVLIWQFCDTKKLLTSLSFVCKEWNKDIPKSITFLDLPCFSGYEKYIPSIRQALKSFTNLTWLNLEANPIIRDEGIKGLTNLTSLNLCHNNQTITDDGIKGLTNLTSLNLAENDIITDEGIKGLTNLTELHLDDNEIITDEGIKGLTNLRNLYGVPKIRRDDLLGTRMAANG